MISTYSTSGCSARSLTVAALMWGHWIQLCFCSWESQNAGAIVIDRRFMVMLTLHHSQTRHSNLTDDIKHQVVQWFYIMLTCRDEGKDFQASATLLPVSMLGQSPHLCCSLATRVATPPPFPLPVTDLQSAQFRTENVQFIFQSSCSKNQEASFLRDGKCVSLTEDANRPPLWWRPKNTLFKSNS